MVGKKCKDEFTMGTSWMCMFCWRKQLHKTSGGVYEKFENNNNWFF
jgi:hypothetical protein